LKKFLLFAQRGWVSFKLKQEETELDEDFGSIAEALDYTRTLPNSKGALLLVFDDKGNNMATLTV
jgi:hypothetical protein